MRDTRRGTACVGSGVPDASLLVAWAWLLPSGRTPWGTWPSLARATPRAVGGAPG
jgi:hypothetical protein